MEDVVNETEVEEDSDSDDPDFYGPTGKELEDFLNTEDTSSVRSTIVSASTSITCKDDENILNINNVLLINKQTEAKYIRLEEVLYQSLLEIRKKIKENLQAIISHTNASANIEFNYIRCGRPYFKDKSNFSPPDNADTLLMKQMDMYDFSGICSVPGWTVKDKTHLVNVLQEMSRDIKKKDILSRLIKLRKENNPKNEAKISELDKQFISLRKKTLKEIALPLDGEKDYDWEAVAAKLHYRHSAKEYQTLWRLFFHPSINKSSWSKSEHQKLQQIADNHSLQDWDVIAQELNSGRTGYQCFVYYRTNMIDSSSSRKWTGEEIEYLQRVVEYFREGTYIPWGKVATAMDQRTKIQVYNKYTRLMESRKGRFLEEEDVVIMNCINKYGFDFKKMTEYLPGRSAIQIRTRYNLLSKYRISTTWSVEDDRKLLQIMANQDLNCSFSNATQFFPGKDRMHIRSRYLTLLKWMKAHPTSDISFAPRRGARRLIHGHADMSLNDALANLSKRMENEVDKKKKNSLTIDSHEADIESGILATLVNEMKEQSKRGYKPIVVTDVIEVTQPQGLPNIPNLQKILVFLKSALDIDKFKNGTYCSKYGGLEDGIPLLGEVKKVKSYSRTQNVETIDMSNAPDVWGKLKLGQLNYVLPPNYSTITGCRVLINNISARAEADTQDNKDDEINLSLMSRRNRVLMDALTKLRERFQSLFLWPLLLSNELPPVQNVTYTPKDWMKAPKRKPAAMPAPSGVIIPLPKKMKIEKRTSKSPTNIDLASDTPKKPTDVNFAELLDNYAMLNGYGNGGSIKD